MAQPVLVPTQYRIECVLAAILPGVNRPYREAAISSIHLHDNTIIRKGSLTSQKTGIFCGRSSMRSGVQAVRSVCYHVSFKEYIYLFIYLFGRYYFAICYDKTVRSSPWFSNTVLTYCKRDDRFYHCLRNFPCEGAMK